MGTKDTKWCTDIHTGKISIDIKWNKKQRAVSCRHPCLCHLFYPLRLAWNIRPQSGHQHLMANESIRHVLKVISFIVWHRMRSPHSFPFQSCPEERSSVRKVWFSWQSQLPRSPPRSIQCNQTFLQPSWCGGSSKAKTAHVTTDKKTRRETRRQRQDVLKGCPRGLLPLPLPPSKGSRTFQNNLYQLQNIQDRSTL